MSDNFIFATQTHRPLAPAASRSRRTALGRCGWIDGDVVEGCDPPAIVVPHKHLLEPAMDPAIDQFDAGEDVLGAGDDGERVDDRHVRLKRNFLLIEGIPH